MRKDDKASVSIIKILAICIIFLFITGIGVMATNAKLINVKIILSNDYEMTVFTSKTTISEILKENHISLAEDETVSPKLTDEIGDNKTIHIIKIEDEREIAEKEEVITKEELLEKYNTITEKIIVEKVTIPYETITKEATEASGTKQNKVIRNGVNGLKEVTYKVKYQNEVEIERVEISSKIIKEPINKIVEVRTMQVTSRGTADRNPALTASTTLAKLAQGITPTVTTFNTSAYCACVKCCGKTNAITASGAKASAWYTVAAGRGYKMGTIIYIPALANKPNGGWFVVQDRGGAISNSKLDIYMNSHSEALQYGRKSLQAYVYEF